MRQWLIKRDAFFFRNVIGIHLITAIAVASVWSEFVSFCKVYVEHEFMLHGLYH